MGIKKTWIVAVALLAAAWPLTASADPASFLTNGGFELCTDCVVDGDATPDGWTSASASALAWGGWSAQERLEGARSYYLHDNSPSLAFWVRSSEERASAGTKYTATVSMKRGPAVGVAGTYTLVLEFLGSGGGLIAQQNVARTVTTAWQAATVSGTAPSGTSFVALRVESSVPNNGDVYVDQAILTAEGGPLPIVQWTSPAAGATLKGQVRLEGTVDPNGAPIYRMQIMIGTWGWQAISYSDGKWWYDWDARYWDNGAHVAQVRAWTMDNRYSTPVTRTFNLQNPPPTVTVDAPAGALQGRATLTGSAEDELGRSITQVEYSTTPATATAPGLWRRASGTSTWSFEWDTRWEADGNHKVWARAWNGKQWSLTTSRVVSILNPAPVVEITSWPAAASGFVTIEGTAHANGGEPVARVEVGLTPWSNPAWWSFGYPANGTETWSASVNTYTLADGTYTVIARGWNGHKYGPVASVGSVVVSNPLPTLVLDAKPAGVVDGVVRFNGTASANGGAPVKEIVALVQGIGTAQTVVKAPAAETWTLEWDTRLFPDGIHSVTLFATNGYRWGPGVSAGDFIVRRLPDLAITNADVRATYRSTPVAEASARVNCLDPKDPFDCVEVESAGTSEPTITIGVQNRGGQTRGFVVWVETRVENLESWRWTCDFWVENIPAGTPSAPARKTLTCPIPKNAFLAQSPERQVRVTIDGGNWVKESDETNNVVTRTVLASPHNGIGMWGQVGALGDRLDPDPARM